MSKHKREADIGAAVLRTAKNVWYTHNSGKEKECTAKRIVPSNSCIESGAIVSVLQKTFLFLFEKKKKKVATVQQAYSSER
jgi:hypothetical protein